MQQSICSGKSVFMFCACLVLYSISCTDVLEDEHRLVLFQTKFNSLIWSMLVSNLKDSRAVTMCAVFFCNTISANGKQVYISSAGNVYSFRSHARKNMQCRWHLQQQVFRNIAKYRVCLEIQSRFLRLCFQTGQRWPRASYISCQWEGSALIVSLCISVMFIRKK